MCFGRAWLYINAGIYEYLPAFLYKPPRDVNTFPPATVHRERLRNLAPVDPSVCSGSHSDAPHGDSFVPPGKTGQQVHPDGHAGQLRTQRLAELELPGEHLVAQFVQPSAEDPAPVRVRTNFHLQEQVQVLRRPCRRQ